MDAVMISCLEVLIPSFIATVYGFAVILRRYKGVYFTMGVLAVLCLMIGQLAYFITPLTGHTQIYGFHIGTLGSAGSCLFLLTANMGPINQLADDGRRELRRYRLLAGIGPLAAVLVTGFCVFIMRRNNYYQGLETTLLLTAITMPPLYFCTKMAVIPDVKGGFIDCMRPFNNTVMALNILNTFERGMRYQWMGETIFQIVAVYVLYALIGICTIVAMLLLKRGAHRWKNF